MTNLIADIGIIIVVATLLAFVARFLKQPLLLGYMLAGIIIGPLGLKLVVNHDVIATLSEIGIAFLLFIVGLELDVRKLKHLGLVSMVVGIGQVLFTFAAGYIICIAIGLPAIYAVYVSIALTLSSTVIIIKLYSDKNELNALHSRIALGVLLVQDFIAVIVLALLSNSGVFTTALVFNNLLIAVGFFVASVVIGTYVLKTIFKPIAKSSELLFLSAVSWCFLYALIAQWLGFSIAIGAFLAGISLAPLPYHIEMASRIKSLRDFFATIFFVTLGMQIVLPNLQQALSPIIILSLFVLIGNPIIVLVLMCAMGFKSRPAFLTGIALAQISEFSLIMMALGAQQGIIPQPIVSMIAVIAVLTFTASSYMITYDDKIYKFFAKTIKPFEKISLKKIALEHLPDKEFFPHFVLCGCNRIGQSIVDFSRKKEKDILVVDFNPEKIKQLMDNGVHCIYGDISDIEILDKIGLKHAEVVISTIPDLGDNLMLTKKIKRENKKATAIVTAEDIDDALMLYEAGADYVILPHLLGGEHISLLLQENLADIKKLLKSKVSHIENLKKRKAKEHGH